MSLSVSLCLSLIQPYVHPLKYPDLGRVNTSVERSPKQFYETFLKLVVLLTFPLFSPLLQNLLRRELAQIGVRMLVTS